MKITLLEANILLQKGQVVAIPTETVYGLGALLKYPKAIDKIFSLKGRPSNNPLIIHVSSLHQIIPFVHSIPDEVKAMANAFWPGPMTVVLPINPKAIPIKARAGLPTAAFRIPQHGLALQLLSQSGPIAMPSANISGKPSATSLEHVEDDFGRDFPVLEGGPCQQGLESTILLFKDNEWEIIRLGALEPEAFKSVLGYFPKVISPHKGEAPLCPGQLYRHYAPQAKLILMDSIPSDLKGVVLGFTSRSYPSQCAVRNLGFLDSASSVAENLYANLRKLDEDKIELAYVDMNFSRQGLWLTIAERLIKASIKP